MAQETAVVRGTLSATASGTTDFTSSGFGTPTAAIVITCAAYTTSNPAVDAVMSIGFWDGTDQRAVGVQSFDNRSTTVEKRASSDSDGLIFHLGLNHSDTQRYTISAITDGIRLTNTEDLTSVNRYCTVILIKGVDAKVLTFTPNSTQDGTATTSSLGFEPKAVFAIGLGATTADYEEAHAMITFGAATEDGTERCWLQGHNNNVSVSDCTMLFSEDYHAGQVWSGTDYWHAEVTTWGSDDLTVTTRDAGTGGDVYFMLILGGDDVKVELGTITTPASTGTDATTTTDEPEALLITMCTCPNTSLQSNFNAEGVSIGLSDGTNDYCHSAAAQDGADTTNTGSEASATRIVELREDDINTDVANASVDSFNSTDFTLDWTTVPGTARKGWYASFGKTAAPAGGLKAGTLSLLGVGV